MAQSETRYCKKCNENTLHDKTIDHLNGAFKGATRLFMAVVTVGISEAGADRYYVCQKCGTKTER